MLFSDPDLSVERSVVFGEVGGNVSVQCHYSNKYRGKKKNWCSFKDPKCSSVGGSVAPAGTKSQIRDDGAGTLSVEMVGVKETDTGWYWCEVGDLQIPVYLNITQHAASMFTIHLAEMVTKKCKF